MFHNRGRVWGGGTAPSQLEKEIQNLTADYELLPKNKNTTD